MLIEILRILKLSVHRFRELEQGSGDRGHRIICAERARVIAHHLVGDGIALRLGDDAGIRLDRHEQAILADKITGIRVIGGHVWRDIFHRLCRRAAWGKDSRGTQGQQLAAYALL